MSVSVPQSVYLCPSESLSICLCSSVRVCLSVRQSVWLLENCGQIEGMNSSWIWIRNHGKKERGSKTIFLDIYRITLFYLSNHLFVRQSLSLSLSVSRSVGRSEVSVCLSVSVCQFDSVFLFISLWEDWRYELLLNLNPRPRKERTKYKTILLLNISW